MDELMKLLDPHLKYISHKFEDDFMYFKVESNRDSFDCPFCDTQSDKVHSRYERSFQDLPIQGYKVMIVLVNKKYLCKNPLCVHTTFAATFSFVRHKAKKTIRLEDEIIKIATNVSSVAASKILRNQIADVGKGTICTLLKKKKYS